MIRQQQRWVDITGAVAPRRSAVERNDLEGPPGLLPRVVPGDRLIAVVQPCGRRRTVRGGRRRGRQRCARYAEELGGGVGLRHFGDVVSSAWRRLALGEPDPDVSHWLGSLPSAWNIVYPSSALRMMCCPRASTLRPGAQDSGAPGSVHEEVVGHLVVVEDHVGRHVSQDPSHGDGAGAEQGERVPATSLSAGVAVKG